jgi:hypothetical protein
MRWTRTTIGALLIATGQYVGRADFEDLPHNYAQAAEGGKHVFVMLAPEKYRKDPPRQAGFDFTKYPRSGLYPDDGSTNALWTIDWYAFSVTVASDGHHLVRWGDWPERGQWGALALAFYKDGKELKRYRVLDLVVEPTKLPRSTSHYKWLKQHRFEDQAGRLTLETRMGERYVFDVKSGETTLPETIKKARLFFREDFDLYDRDDHVTFHPSLEDAGAAFDVRDAQGPFKALVGIVAFNHKAGFNFLRTVATGYNAVDFTCRMGFCNAGAEGADGVVFIGLGNAESRQRAPGEAMQGLVLQITPREAGRPSVRRLEQLELPAPSTTVILRVCGPSRGGQSRELGRLEQGFYTVRLSKQGDAVSFAVLSGDKQLMGCTNSLKADAAFLDQTNTRIFFGAGARTNWFNDLTIRPLPAEVRPPR